MGTAQNILNDGGTVRKNNATAHNDSTACTDNTTTARNHKDPVRILFVCAGNICRSPMAEFCMKHLTEQTGTASHFYMESAATHSWNDGKPVHEPARRTLAQKGIDCSGKLARSLSAHDYRNFDILIGMDCSNISDMRRICGGDPEHKIHLLLDFTDSPGEIDDPWYTDDYETAWNQIHYGCRALLDCLTAKSQHPQ